MPNWHSRQHGTEDTSLATTSGNSSEAEARYLGTSACAIRGLHLTASFLGEKSAARPRRRTWSAQAAAVGRAGAAILKGSGTTGAPAAPGGISLGLCLHQEPQRATRSNSLTQEFLQGRTVSPCTLPPRRGLQWVRDTTLRTGLWVQESCGQEGADGDRSRVLTVDGLHCLLSFQ